jgi:hypothetical protein
MDAVWIFAVVVVFAALAGLVRVCASLGKPS